MREAPGASVIDVVWELAAAAHRIVLGPTRHAYFNFRVAPSIAVEGAGVLCDDRGSHASASTMDARARWVAASGPVGGGHRAGVALAPRGGGRAWWWFVSDWGVATASPCRDAGLELRPGAGAMTLEARYAVFDGDAGVKRCADLLGA